METQRWFGREPALVLQTIAALLALLIGFGVPGLNDAIAASGMAVLTAGASVWTAFHVRPWAPTVFGGLITAGAAFLLTLGYHLPQAGVAGLIAFASVAMALITRPQQDYQDPPGAVAKSATGGVIGTGPPR